MSSTPPAPPEAPVPPPADPTAAAPDPAAPQAGAAPAVPAARRRRPVRAAGLLGLYLLVSPLLLAAVLVLAVVIGALGTEAGSRQLVAIVSGLVPGLEMRQTQGALSRDFSLGRLRLTLADGRRLLIEDLRWRGLSLGHADGGWWPDRLVLDELGATRIALTGEAPPSAPSAAPTSLVLPFGLEVRRVVLQRLELPALGEHPIEGVSGALRALPGTAGAVELRLDTLHRDRLALSGRARLGTAAPLPLDASLSLTPRPGGTQRADALSQAWTLTLAATGALSALDLRAALDARAQSLQATARIAPFEPQPLRALGLRVDGFDLGALSSAAPVTALSGEARLALDERPADGAPVHLKVDLRNERPLPWDRRGLPLRRVQIEAASALGQPLRGELGRLRVEFADGDRPAGRLEGRGDWRTEGDGRARRLLLGLDLTIEQLLPRSLDRRAPPLSITGPLSARLDEPLPQDGAATGPTDGGAKATPPAAPPRAQATRATARPTPLAPRRWSLETDLRSPVGDALAAPGAPAARLALSARGEGERVEIEHAEARAGDTLATLAGSAERQQGQWAVTARTAWTRFDPLLWWPGLAERLGPGPHRLNANGSVDLRLPPAATRQDAGAWRGQAVLALRDSLLAGLATSADLSLRAAAPGAPPGPLQLAGQLDIAGQHLDLSGELPPGEAGAQNAALTLRWRAPALERLMPLLGRLGVPALQGDAEGELALAGTDARAVLSGRLDSTALAIGQGARLVAAGRTQARWRLGLRDDAPLSLQASLERLTVRPAQLELRALDLALDGRPDAHQLRASVDTRRLNADGTPATAGGLPQRLLARLQAEGAWVHGAGERGWKGRVQALQVREPGAGDPAADAVASAVAAGPRALSTVAAVTVGASGAEPLPPALTTPQSWLSLDPVSLAVLERDGELGVHLGPTRARVFDAVLRLARLDWTRDARGATRALDLTAELEPLGIAALLQRAQPEFGWAGDLQVAGRVQLALGPQGLNAELDLGRVRGDLQIVDADNPANPGKLGLTELALAYRAQQGRWELQQRLSGANLGTLAGRQTVTAPPGAFWPPAEAPVEGLLDLRIANLSHWGRFLPAGWRVGGSLATQARVSGRFGQPLFTGELEGQGLSVRNLLAGVDLREGQLKASMDGARTRIESVQIKAGDGVIRGSGEFTADEAWRLTLDAQAERFALLQRVDRRVVLSGQAALRLEPRLLQLGGKLKADEIRIDIGKSDAPSLGDDVEVERLVRDDTDMPLGPAPRKAAGVPRLLALDLQADLGENARLRGHGINTRLTGVLKVTSPGGKLAVNGTIRTEEGTLATYGQKLSIERGEVIFTGVYDNPRLDIEAIRPDLETVRVGATVTGTAQNPRVRLFSEPEMSDTDKLSWLLMGRASDGLGRTDLALLQRAAYALISGESDSPGLVQAVGLDEFSVRQSSDGEVRETVVTLGKQLSRRWYVGYERSLNAATGNWQLIYRIAQRFTLRAQRGTSESALDLIWTWRWGSGKYKDSPWAVLESLSGEARPAESTRPADGASAPAGAASGAR